MPNTSGFGLLGQLDVSILRQKLDAAWVNGTIPHDITVPAGTAFGGLVLEDGHAAILEGTMTLDMAPAANGVRLGFQSHIGVQIANPPVPSLRSFELDATVSLAVQLAAHSPAESPGVTWIGVNLPATNRADVFAVLPVDPVPTVSLSLIKEFVQHKYTSGAVQTYMPLPGFSHGVFTGDVEATLLNDDSVANLAILVTEPMPGQLKISLPIHIRIANGFYGGQTLPSPMGVLARVGIQIALETPPGRVRANLPAATVAVDSIDPAPVAQFPGSEGTNYTHANTFSGGLMETQMRTLITARASAAVTSIGMIDILVPTRAQIETFIADQIHMDLVARGFIYLWTPQPPEGSPVTVVDPQPKALADALAIAMNPEAGANLGGITRQIPAARSCTIAMSRKAVLDIIESRRSSMEVPDEVDGHEVRLNSLNFNLVDGAILVTGSVTVVDAILGSIDVDADFSVKIGLRWIDNADGTQQLEPFEIEHDVDLSLLAWILSFLLGFITFGIVGGIIALVVVAVVEGIAEKIGGVVIRDNVTNQITGIGPWPQQVEGIGTVEARFDNPVLIDPLGVGFPDLYLVTPTFATTIVATAKGGGPYTVAAGSNLLFQGGPAKPSTDYRWEFGDGATATTANATHAYGDNGVYVAKLRTKVNQVGGSVTRDFAKVHVLNVPAKVNAGPDLELDEGEEFEFIASFTDPEWKDTHIARFDFGDSTMTVQGALTETNKAPAATGTARAKHAYCDDGDYVLTVRVIDDDGGVGMDARRVRVRNVPPTVECLEDVYAYPCVPVRLVAMFTDPGWCDTHSGTWDFGDCKAPQPATIESRRQKPKTIGACHAVNTYAQCGEYFARCVVVDDDGGRGSDFMVVRVIDLLNGDFESGYHRTELGQTANHWVPFGVLSDLKPSIAGVPLGVLESEEYLVHGGQRSQKMRGHVGLAQQIGANRAWDYYVHTWYHLPAGAEGTVRLGIDPNGGEDPAAPEIVWSEGSSVGNWSQLTAHAMATSRRISVFLQCLATEAYFDDIRLIPYPCPFELDLPESIVPPRTQCADWADEKEARPLGNDHERSGFRFRTQPSLQLYVALWGLPQGQGKLQFPDEGVAIQLPFAAKSVTCEVVLGARVVKAQGLMLDTQGSPKVLAEAETPPQQQVVHTLRLTSDTPMTHIQVTGGAYEGLLVRICTHTEPPETVHRLPRSVGERVIRDAFGVRRSTL